MGRPDPDASDSTQRLDKWLWAARFFKTRALAAEAVAGGKVHVDGERAKPARRIGPGTRLLVHKGPLEWDLEVVALCEQRRPATEAAGLYQESPESAARRHAAVAERRAQAALRPRGLGRPTKRDRRELTRLKGR